MTRLAIIILLTLIAFPACAAPQSIDVRDYSPSSTDWGPALGQALNAATTQNLPVYLPPGQHPVKTPVYWYSTASQLQGLTILGNGAQLCWQGNGTCLTIGAPSGSRVFHVTIRDLVIYGPGCSTYTVGLELRNVTYSHFHGIEICDCGVDLSLMADNESCAYLTFYDLNCSRATTCIRANQMRGPNACLNQILFERPICMLSAANQTVVSFGPTIAWPPSLWTFRDGDVEAPGGVLVNAADTCSVEFNNTYFEAKPQMTVNAKPGQVSFVDCKGSGVPLSETRSKR